jgi:hypothetical protein
VTESPNWHTTIHARVLADAKLLGLLPERETTFASLPKKILDALLPELVSLEKAATGSVNEHRKTIAAMERIIARRVWNALTPFSTKALGRFEQLDFDPYATPAATRDWCSRLDAALAPVNVPRATNSVQG